MKDMLILVDFSWLLNKMFFGFKDHFINKDGEKIFVGSLLGYTLFAERISNKYPNAKVIYCMDGECIKKKLNDDYKANRDDERKKQVYKDTNTIINLLSNIKNFYFAKNDKQEADDLIANIAYKFKDDFKDIVIYSGDKDFYQLLDDFKLSNEYKKGFKYITPNDVFGKFGVDSKHVLQFRILDGDRSDNLKAPVSRIRTEFKKEIAEKWDSINIDDFIDLMYSYKDSTWGKSASQYLEVVDKVQLNMDIMNLRKYSLEENRFNFNIFKNNNPDLNLINFYELRQFERFMYDYMKGRQVID